MADADITEQTVEALSANGYLTRNGLARSIGVTPAAIVTALDEIEAAGIKLMRVRGPGGGAQFIGKRMRKSA